MDEENYKQRIYRKLTDAFQPTVLEIRDESDQHKGHVGHHAKGETHFSVKIVSHLFDNKRTLDRHRMIYETLTEELDKRVHALRLETMTVPEYNLKKM